MLIRTEMACAISCLNQADCIGFEYTTGRNCKKIEFLGNIQIADENSAPASLVKRIWLSSTLIKNENYPEVKGKTFKYRLQIQS